MSTRSATNKRTQNHEYTGMARKSAASARPARSAASSVRVQPASSKARRREQERGESLEGLSKEERKARKREIRAHDDRVYSVSTIMLKDDPDYKRNRVIFWILLALGVVVLMIAWGILSYLGEAASTESAVAQLVPVVIAYIFVIGAFVFDFVRIRPLRNEYRARAEGMSDAKLVEFIERDASNKAGKAKKDATPEEQSGTASEEAKRRRPKKNHRSRR